jgi:hypothetical protein
MMRQLGLIVLATLAVGCSSSSKTRLELSGDPKGPAVYEFREVLWRERPAGVEVVGYGVMPFYNSPIAIDYNPRWPTNGFVIFRMRGEARDGGGYAITILGPAKRLGPGDDEMLSGEANGVIVSAPDEGTRRIEVRDVAMRSRNKPDGQFTLNGTIVAKAAEEGKFEKEVAQFGEERGYRKP